jgi:hypothetical protein
LPLSIAYIAGAVIAKGPGSQEGPAAGGSEPLTRPQPAKPGDDSGARRSAYAFRRISAAGPTPSPYRSPTDRRCWPAACRTFGPHTDPMHEVARTRTFHVFRAAPSHP